MYQILWQIQKYLKPKYLFASHNYVCVATGDALYFLCPTDGTPLLPPLTSLEDLPLADYQLIGGAVDPTGNLLLTLLPPRLVDQASLWSLKLIKRGAVRKRVQCRRLYEAPSTQLSIPLLNNGTVSVIQSGPELVVIDSESAEVKHVVSLPYLASLHRNCVSFAYAANQLCIALCDGKIVALDPKTGHSLTTLREPDGRTLSPITSDGVHLFFGASVRRKGRSPSYILALDGVSGQQLWTCQIPADRSGRHRLIAGQPLLIKDKLYVTGLNHYFYALDSDTGQQRLSYEMPDQIEVGPVCTGNVVVVADQKGNIHALQSDQETFTVTWHYDLKTPPILNEWHPLILTLINTSPVAVQHTVLRLSGDFAGRSENHTQELYKVAAGEIKRCSIELKPTAAGSSVFLGVTIDYQYNDSSPMCREEINLSIPVRRSQNITFGIVELGRSPNGKWHYNYIAIQALLTAALTSSDVNRICYEKFRPVYHKVAGNNDKREKIRVLIEYAHDQQQVEQLLMEVKHYSPIRYEQYLEEIKLLVWSPDGIEPDGAIAKFDVFLAHNNKDKPAVEALARKLKERGLKPWLDKEQILPGRWFQDDIQQAIKDVKSAAIIVGPHGLGKWQVVELRSFISRCVDSGLPVIPILLPGVDDIPESLLFLKELNYIRFITGIDEVEALDELESGITGKRRTSRDQSRP